MIDKFDGKYFFLSNFYPLFESPAGNMFTVEHAFQASKTLDPEWASKIRTAATPNLAKKLGRRAPLRQGWDDIKEDVMNDLLFWKFSTYFPELRRMLAETGSQSLVEGNCWHDTYWGVCTGDMRCRFGPHEPIGENRLGKLLIKVRSSIK